jgi:hypothetical protein
MQVTVKLRLSSLWNTSARDARLLLDASLVIVTTWLLLGWWFDEPLFRDDGPRLFAPYLRSALEAGHDWTANSYRFGVFGGSAMHPAVGTSPLVLMCGALGISTTTAGNLSALFAQACLGFFAIIMIEALITTWSGERRQLSLFERAITVVCCAFAPSIGWRFAAGHENLIVGLLPLLAAVSLWWSARANTLSWTSLLVGWFAVFHSLPSMGQQTIVFSLVFGAPVLIVTLVGGRTGCRLVRAHVAVVLVLAAGVLCAAPLVMEMLHYHLGDDATRSVSRSMFYAYGHPYAHDWIASLPWTTAATEHWPGKIAAHETNYPLGPLVVFVVALWPRGVARDLGFAALVGALLAIAFSLDLAPIASLLRNIPMVDAFRVPARAILPVVVFIPILALAVLWMRLREPLAWRGRWPLIAFTTLATLAAPLVPSVARELAVWFVCVGLCVVLRRKPAHATTAALAAVAIVGALGVAAFTERYKTAQPAQRIEQPPQALRERLLAEAPDLAMPLNRVQVPDQPPPFGKSMAFAAGLPTLDGVGFPPRRFLRLLSALWNEPISAAEADFDLTHRDRFDILAQLYNVKYLADANGSLTRLPNTNGTAWFTRQLAIIDDPREMIRVLRMHRVDVRAALAQVAWVLRDEAPAVLSSAPTCASARVENVMTDDLGQSAKLDVVVDGTCVLVVATNYVSMFRATDGVHELEVFPVDVALTGIIVPNGTTTVKLGPVARRQWWWTVLGYIALAGALAWLASARVVADGRNEKTPP